MTLRLYIFCVCCSNILPLWSVLSRQCIKYAAILLIFSVTMVGCAAMEKGTVESDEKMLSAAGFKMKPADTPGKIAHVQSMQQRKIITHEKNGIVYYAYADAEFCKCLYMGTQKNYAEYLHCRTIFRS